MTATVVIKGACYIWCRLIKSSSVQALAQDALTDWYAASSCHGCSTRDLMVVVISIPFLSFSPSVICPSLEARRNVSLT